MEWEEAFVFVWSVVAWFEALVFEWDVVFGWSVIAWFEAPVFEGYIVFRWSVVAWFEALVFEWDVVLGWGVETTVEVQFVKSISVFAIVFGVVVLGAVETDFVTESGFVDGVFDGVEVVIDDSDEESSEFYG